ncbi:MAG: NRDE family protein [Polaromonas sp.]|uniref:NRDE family protein n=1 Tax=Polaromonas sp. TaxID=1869339 RepID=UPI0027304A9C|nr:NRDE family protein [Polaromonas sp.]MDP1740069.1 NRDE family protein [Polaromonas sp.]MDP1955550.1 NRDE family protein [Polaromonas sp.]
MCLIAFAIGASPRWPLVVAANRDEFLDRPTLPLARWRTDAGTEIISGRDLRAGGTWLGLTPHGRLAMLTNVRGPASLTGDKSRGELVTRWLDSDVHAAGFMAQIDAEAYGGFNLVLGDFKSGAWHWLSNKPGPGLESRALRPGIYGLSNGALDTPWPKTLGLKKALHSALAAPSEETLEGELMAALRDRRRASRDDLPSTGVPLALEEALSSAFVDFPEHGYGTRCSTVLVASAAAKGWDLMVQEYSHAHCADDRPGMQNIRLNWS